jgi:acyl-CoA thioesterase-2
MGDLSVDTAVVGGDGRYTGQLSRAWEIWGPMGGYIASFALRAVAAESRFARPASFSCHYLGVASFDEPIDIAVEPLRTARSAESLRARITQGDRAILDATVWAVGDVEGLEHDLTEPPDVPGPEALPTIQELVPDGEPPFPFWLNFEQRPLDFTPEWPPSEPLHPTWRSWLKFIPQPTFDDLWVDACRALVLVDVVSWPAAHRPHAYLQAPFIAPSLDLYVAFHQPRPDDPWLLTDGHGDIAADGLMGWTGRLWSSDQTLVASGMGQLLCRPVRA